MFSVFNQLDTSINFLESKTWSSLELGCPSLRCERATGDLPDFIVARASIAPLASNAYKSPFLCHVAKIFLIVWSFILKPKEQNSKRHKLSFVNFVTDIKFFVMA